MLLKKVLTGLTCSVALSAAVAVPTIGCAAQTSAATNADERSFVRDFDAFLTASLARLPSIPAISVAVSRHDGPIYVRAFGKADIERNVSATPDTRFYIASSTKSYVGLAFALLDQRGTIDLDWTLAELAPDLVFAPELQADKVTLRHLLSHTHGMVAQGIEHRLAYSGEHDPETLWRLLPTMRANAEAPLGSFNYGNLGYNVAAMLVERRLGRRWQDILESEVLSPLGARQTHTQGLAALRAREAFAAPYFGAGPNGPERLSLLKVDENMQSAGGMFASGNDLARWVQLQLAAHRPGARSPLPASIVAATHAPIGTLDDNFGPFRRIGYGLGWYSGPFDGETLYHSFGGYSGARSHVSFMPARDLGVAIVTNDEGAGSVFVDIAAIYAYHWFDGGPEAAQREAAPLLDRLVGQAQQRTAEVTADRARRAARQWQLSLPRPAYSGRYCNPNYGTIVVRADPDRINVAMGVINTEAAPFTQPDSMRVELIPNQGEAIPFTIADGRVTGLKVSNAEFTRC